MPIQKDGQTYYTLEEASDMLDKSIEKNADKLIADLRKRKVLKNTDVINA